MKKVLMSAAMVLAMAAVAAPAGAADQVITATIASTLSMDTAPTATVSAWSLAATGANTTSGGSVGINSNQAYTVGVTADKAVLSEYNTATSAYVTSGKTLAASLSVIAARTSGTATVAGVAATAIVGLSTLMATGTGLGTDVYSVTLSQPTTIADAALASGRTYRIVLTYAAASTL